MLSAFHLLQYRFQSARHPCAPAYPGPLRVFCELPHTSIAANVDHVFPAFKCSLKLYIGKLHARQKHRKISYFRTGP
jgi:hypothetical protein